jgi:hypothetical protein
MTWTIGGVTLSYGPERLRMPMSTKKDTLEDNDDGYPVNINTGLDFSIQLEGTIPTADAAKISSLLALVGTEVALTTTDGLLDGNWNFDSFEPGKNGPGPVYSYIMRLSKGSQNITLG